MGHGQQALAARFARKGEDRFSPPTRWRPGPVGLPLIMGATTHLICASHTLVAVGDHELVVGRVLQAIIGPSEPPLVHHQGRFTRPKPGSRTATRPADDQSPTSIGTPTREPYSVHDPS